MEKKQQRNTKKAAPTVADMQSPFDPQGSYTGKPQTPGETPVQDADDL